MANKYRDKTKAPKRTKDQIIHDRKRVAELVLQGYKHQEIADKLEIIDLLGLVGEYLNGDWYQAIAEYHTSRC